MALGAGLKRSVLMAKCFASLWAATEVTGPEKQGNCRSAEASVFLSFRPRSRLPSTDEFISLLGLCPQWRSASCLEMNHSPLKPATPTGTEQGSWVESPSDKVPSRQVSEYDAFPIGWVLLHGAVGTLQLSSIDELVEGISGDHVATDELDGRVGI